MATITKSASAPTEPATFCFAAGNFSLSDAKPKFETDDAELIAAAAASDELEVSYDAPAEVFEPAADLPPFDLGSQD